MYSSSPVLLSPVPVTAAAPVPAAAAPEQSFEDLVTPPSESGESRRTSFGIFSNSTTALVYGLPIPTTTHDNTKLTNLYLRYGMQLNAVQSMLDFDHLCGRTIPSVRAIIYPFSGAHYRKFFWGSKETMIPVVPDIAQALAKFPKDKNVRYLHPHPSSFLRNPNIVGHLGQLRLEPLRLRIHQTGSR